MPKHKKDKDTTAEEKADKVLSEVSVVEEKPAPKKEDKPKDKPVPAPVFGRKPSERRKAQSRRMTFDQYAKAKGFKEHHVPGLRAYCDNPDKLRTANEWDEHLKDY